MKQLDELYQDREHLELLVKMAKSFGDRVRIGKEIISASELQDMLDTTKAEIATRISNSKLKRIK